MRDTGYNASPSPAGLLQPLNALWRGHPGDGTTARRVWEVGHKWVGRLLLLAAAANIYLGLSTELLGTSGVLVGLGTAWAALLATAAVVLSVLRKQPPAAAGGAAPGPKDLQDAPKTLTRVGQHVA